MSPSFGLDQLHVYAHPAPAALHAAFEHVAHIELTPDLLEIDRLAFVCEGCAPADDEGPGDA